MLWLIPSSSACSLEDLGLLLAEPTPLLSYKSKLGLPTPGPLGWQQGLPQCGSTGLGPFARVW